MKKEIATLLVTALRSGKYTQGKTYLVTTIPKNENGDTHAFCATGVLCQIASSVGIVKRVKRNGAYGYVAQNAPKTATPCTTGVPAEVKSWAGMNSSNGCLTIKLANGRRVSTTITNLNDVGAGQLGSKPWTFEKLANLIEKRYADI